MSHEALDAVLLLGRGGRGGGAGRALAVPPAAAALVVARREAMRNVLCAGDKGGHRWGLRRQGGEHAARAGTGASASASARDGAMLKRLPYWLALDPSQTSLNLVALLPLTALLDRLLARGHDGQLRREESCSSLSPTETRP